MQMTDERILDQVLRARRIRPQETVIPELLAQRRNLVELHQRLPWLMRLEYRARRQKRRDRQIVAIVAGFEMLRCRLERLQRRRRIGLLQRHLRLRDEMLGDPCR